MDDAKIYNTKDNHFNIEDIYKRSRVGAPEDELETLEMQALALDIFKTGVSPCHRLSPTGWLPQGEHKTKIQVLSQLVDFAFANVPMYSEIYRSVGYELGSIRSEADFKSLPVLTRSILNRWNDDDRLSLGRKAIDTYFVGTSGSSGKSLKVFYDQNAAIVETLESFKQYASYINESLSADRWIYNIHMSRGWLSSLLGAYRTFTLNEVPPLDALIEHFAKIRPVFLCALPSHLWELSPIGDLSRFGIRAISTNSEQSSRVERSKLSEIFGVPVLDEYSSVELGVIAYECSAGHYHVNEEGLHIELLDVDDSGFGKVVATDFRSWVMPLIRYDQGDLASWDKSVGVCSCTKAGNRFSEIRGRADDYFLREDGSKVSSATLLNIVDTLFTGPASTLKEFRLVQEAPREIRFEFVVVSGEELAASSKSQLVESLLINIEPTIKVEFIQRTKLSETPSYKRKKVIRAFA
ncbi:phenylacetate--CoA ligase family protein [Pseudomonas sp. M47T1]|uniref:phenylacetate--CoA ligase family protein n=1 Tax=Pseudomonas sp. M47T1 TaxID=1179778 RepID=UPI000314753B|nr:hypothetical protein [Pseudomonas sp. M47T1]